LEKFLDTHEEVLLPEAVSFETSVLNVEEKSQLALVLAVFDQVFQQTLSPGSKTIGYEHHVSTGDHPHFRNRPFRVSPAEKDLIKAEVQKFVETGLVQPSPSPWASRIVFVPKKDDKFGFV
jgi:hypothetical protein